MLGKLFDWELVLTAIPINLFEIDSVKSIMKKKKNKSIMTGLGIGFPLC